MSTSVRSPPTPDVRGWLADTFPDESLLVLTESEYDAAILGVVERPDGSHAVAYDVDRLTRIVHERDGGEPDEAADHVSYNILGGCRGPGAPVFVFPVPAGDDA